MSQLPTAKFLVWSTGTSDFEIKEFKNDPTDATEIGELIMNLMPPYYDEIDQNFVRSVLLACERFGEDFHEKGKKVFMIRSPRGLLGCAVTTPKRGGSVKLSPILVQYDRVGALMVNSLIESIAMYYRGRFRKLFSIIPIYEATLWTTLRKIGFHIEGILKEPYKPGVDCIVLGKFLEEGSTWRVAKDLS